MSKILNYKFFAITFGILIGLASLALYINSPDREFIGSDGIGYYSYLPAIFIDNDITFNATVDKYSSKRNEIPPLPGICQEGNLLCDEYIGLRPLDDGRWINKYPVGLSVILSPFFFGADIYTQITGGARDGMSLPYQTSIVIAGLVFFQLGLYFTYKVLRKRFNNNLSLFLLVFLILGTNILHYVIYEPSMTHIYSYTFITLTIYLLDKYLTKPSKKLILLLGITIAFTGLIRNLNLLFAIVPLYVILDSLKKGERFKLFKYIALIWGLCLIIVFIPQMLYWKYSTGSYIAYGYLNESFNFLNPHLFNVLFNLEHNGLFFWHPLLLLVFPGAYYFIKTKDILAPISLIYLAIFTYIISCWWAYWFGYSFGHRAFTDYYILFLIPIGYLFKKILTMKRSYLIIITLLIFILLLLNLIQMNNYWRGIVAGHNLTWHNYWINFFNPNIF